MRKRNTTTKRIRHSVGEAEFKKLVTHTMSNSEIKEHTRLKLLRAFHSLYYTGIRVNEVQDLTIEQVKDLIDNKSSTIYTSKSNKERQLYISDEAAKKFKKLIDPKDENEHRWIHSWSDKTKPMHKISLIQLVNRYMKDVLGTGFSSHSFRQGIITDMFARGVGTKVVQQFIGHSSAATTLRYDTPTPERIKQALVR
jgi:site-specific recombinase XerD